MSVRHTITAVIYDKKGRVLSVGQNSYTKTHTLQAYHAKKVGLPEKTFQHAELSAVVKCKDISKAHKISIFRYTKDGKPANAKPCLVCQSLLNAVGISLIEHT